MEKQKFIEDHLLLIPKETFEAFLKEEDGTDLFALYCFYYYTAKWQATNQIKATTGYTAKGLKWSEKRVQGAKARLIQLGLIEDITRRDEISNVVVGWYIRIKYLWKTHPAEIAGVDQKSTPTVSHPVANRPTNALLDININALNNILNVNPLFIELSNHLKDLMKKNNPDAKITESQIKNWANDVRLMVERDKRTPENIKLVMEWSQNNDFWKTNILSMGTLREKFDRLTMQMKSKSGSLLNRERGLEYKVKKGAINV